MAKGKKYNDDVKEKAYALLACNNNAQVVADELGIPYTTVKTWEKKWVNEAQGQTEARQMTVETATKPYEDNIIELRKKKKEEFVENAWRLIGKVQSVLERRIDRAIESEDTIDSVVDGIKTDKEKSSGQKSALLSKLGEIKVESVKELAIVLGTLYDKQALANKEATSIVEGNVSLKKFEDF